MRTCEARLSIRRPHTASRAYGRGTASSGEPAVGRQRAPRSGFHQATGHTRGKSGCRPSEVSGRRNSRLANSSAAPTDWLRFFAAVAESGPRPTRWARPPRPTHPAQPPAPLIKGSDRAPLKSAECFDGPRATLEPPQSIPPLNPNRPIDPPRHGPRS
jgi:hypothetical protein